MKKKRKLNNPVKRIYVRLNLSIKETDYGLKPIYDQLSEIKKNYAAEDTDAEMTKVIFFVLHEYCRQLSTKTPSPSTSTVPGETIAVPLNNEGNDPPTELIQPEKGDKKESEEAAKRAKEFQTNNELKFY